ncbi:MAG: GNAT family N-acetyltransferase [Thermomicrobiales bacterium]
MTDNARGEIRIVQEDDGNTKVSLDVDGTTVSWTFVVPMTIRIGESCVRMDGIGGVETLEEHRNQGYSRRVLHAALAHMLAGDAPLTTLYGIPDYYPRWGYATVGSEGRMRLTRLDRDNELLPGHSVRAAQTGDLSRLRTIYDDATRHHIGPLVRYEGIASWSTLARSIDDHADECRVVVDDTDEVLAYAWRASKCWWMDTRVREDPEGLHIGEAFAMTPSAADSLLAAARQWAIETGKQHADIHLPPLGVVGMSVRLQDAANLSLTFRDAQFMGRSIGISALMSAIEPGLQARWARSAVAWTGNLVIRTAEDDAMIVITPDGLNVAPMDPASEVVAVELTVGEVARLVLGSFSPVDLLDRIGVARDISDVLAILFPEQRPYIYPADRF